MECPVCGSNAFARNRECNAPDIDNSLGRFDDAEECRLEALKYHGKKMDCSYFQHSDLIKGVGGDCQCCRVLTGDGV